jgi:hypothetical protein
MAVASQIRSYTYDADLALKDAGLVAADAAATVGGSARRINVGDAVFKGVAVIDVTAIEVASNDEFYRIIVQGSTSPTFASDIENLAEITLAAAAVRPGGAKVSTTGRYELFFVNEQDGVVYPHIRLFTDVGGTIATGINYSAFIGRDHLTHA